MKIKEVIAALEKFAPLPLQEDWDNSGLQIGLTEAEVSGALLCLDITEEIIDEAIARRCNLIISHHPLIFRGVKRISSQSEVERCIVKAIKNDITIVSMHTNADNALEGVNFQIAKTIGLIDARLFHLKPGFSDSAGSGVIGNLAESMDSAAFLQMIKERFNAASIKTNQMLSRPISKVAICGGAGSFLLNEAIDNGADAFITGEMHYHDFFDHKNDTQICVIGHYESEQFTPLVFKDVIEKSCPIVKTYITNINTNPIKYI